MTAGCGWLAGDSEIIADGNSRFTAAAARPSEASDWSNISESGARAAGAGEALSPTKTAVDFTNSIFWVAHQ